MYKFCLSLRGRLADHGNPRFQMDGNVAALLAMTIFGVHCFSHPTALCWFQLSQ